MDIELEPLFHLGIKGVSVQVNRLKNTATEIHLSFISESRRFWVNVISLTILMPRGCFNLGIETLLESSKLYDYIQDKPE